LGDDGGSCCNMMREEGCKEFGLATEQSLSVPLSVIDSPADGLLMGHNSATF